MENNIGYKILDENLQAFNGFQYEIGKTYETEKPITVGLYGFHYYKKIVNLFRYGTRTGDRFCKVEVLGNISGSNICCTNRIKILEEINISPIDIVKYTYAINCGVTGYKLEELLAKELDDDMLNTFIRCGISIVREEMARQGFCLDRLINDPNPSVREAVANQGYGLGVLISDPIGAVRGAVANRGYGLDILINDPDVFVREAVARQGYKLDILVNDPDSFVRAAVADQGYGLDKLIDDISWYVRRAVVNQGYKLDVLINDENSSVEKAVLDYMRNNNPGLYSKIIRMIKLESNK